jgi:thioredoxin reductase (NADPH)
VTTMICEHVEEIRDVEPSSDGCLECPQTGDDWVHLRLCLTCGHVGCCDRGITLVNRKTGEERTFQTRWLFVCIGGSPRTDWAVESGVARDEASYLVTGPDLHFEGRSSNGGWPLDRNPYYLETNVPGLFAAGDVRHGSVKRCASNVGEGAMAVTFAHRYLSTG